MIKIYNLIGLLFWFPLLLQAQTPPCNNDSMVEVIEYVYVPAYTKKTTIPPTYHTEFIKIWVDNPQQWDRREPNCLSDNPEDCKQMKMIEIPACWKTITRTTVVAPAVVIEECVPASYQKQKVCKHKYKPAITLSPNPVQNEFTLQLPYLLEPQTALIYNLQGCLLKTITITEINTRILVTDLANGSYILQIGNKPYRFEVMR